MFGGTMTFGKGGGKGRKRAGEEVLGEGDFDDEEDKVATKQKKKKKENRGLI